MFGAGVRNANPEQSARFLNRLLGNLTHKNTDPRLRAAIAKMGRENHMNPNMAEISRNITQEIRSFFAKKGLNLPALETTWRQNTTEKRYDGVFMRNFDTICRLEGQSPGICKILQQEYGINNFGRYPVEQLVRQYDQRADSNTPYGVVMYPLYDHTGAFYGTQKMLRQMDRDIAGKHTMRIVEVSNLGEAVKKLAHLRVVNGKMGFGIFGGHGSKDSITFGELDIPQRGLSDLTLRGTLKSTDIDPEQRRQRAMIRHFFTENPTFVLLSCFTGSDKGLGEKVSQLGVGVIASDESTGINAVRVTFDENGNPKFDVKFSSANAQFFRTRPVNSTK